MLDTIRVRASGSGNYIRGTGKGRRTGRSNGRVRMKIRDTSSGTSEYAHR